MREPMSHPALHELLGYLDDELSPHARTRVELHVENCVECRAQLDDLSVANAEIVVAHSEPREDGWDGIAQQQAALRARLAEMIASSTPQKQPSLRWTTSLAYAAALIVLTAIGGFFLQQRSKGPEQSLALPNPSFTPGATRQVSLGELCSVNDDEVVDRKSVV